MTTSNSMPQNDSSSVPRAAASAVLPEADMGSPTPLESSRVISPGSPLVPSCPQAPPGDADPSPGSHRQWLKHIPLVLKHRLFTESLDCVNTVQEAGRMELKGQLPEEKSRDPDYPLLSHPTQGMATQDHEEASTLKVRSWVAGELAMGPHPAYSAEARVLQWHRHQALVSSALWFPFSQPHCLSTKHTGQEQSILWL